MNTLWRMAIAAAVCSLGPLCEPALATDGPVAHWSFVVWLQTDATAPIEMALTPQ